ncbi:MAG TPA: STAS domain-containing protein [Candidatus Acidoferrales bacterium]|jgi:anti-sigma B factor antagonist|nr:STAS domain-containing protein [Candidatus Acidoferrales bacterium]
MSLEIEHREREGIFILSMKGRITLGKEATALREKVGELNAAGNRNLVFILTGVDYIDSTGLGALVMSASSLRKNGGNVKLVGLNRRTIELLVMTKLATIFEIFSDEQDAVNSYFPDRILKTFDILNFVNEMEREE